MSEHDEQRVRTMAGWIGVEISKSRVRTPGKAGYGLYRVRAVRKNGTLPWTDYAYTLGNLRSSIWAAILEGTPAQPGALRLLSGPEQLDGPVVTVPTRWTTAYRGRRDLGLGAELAGLERSDPEVGAAAESCERARGELVRKAREGLVAIRPEYAAQLDLLGALLDAGLVEMVHVEGCVCDAAGRRFTAACLDATMPQRMRQRATNDAFQADHLRRRAYGLEARQRAKLGDKPIRGSSL